MIVIGLDIGSSRIKAAAYDETGVELAEASEDFALVPDTSGRIEQDPDAVVRHAFEVIAAVSAALSPKNRSVDAVALSAPMHSILPLDAAAQPLGRAVTWADNRAASEAAFLKAEWPELFRRTGTPLHAMSPVAKLLWFRNHESATWERAATWVSLKDYVLLCLTGEVVAERSTAAASGLLSVTGGWDESALEVAGLEESRLPPVVPVTQSFTVLPELVDRLGLRSDTVIVAGVSDGVGATLGVGAFDDDAWCCSFGTSAAVRWLADRPLLDDAGRVFCYAVSEDLWLVGGATNNAGLALQWVLDELFPDLSSDALSSGSNIYDVVDDMAEGVPAGCDGLLFVPYLTGERAPQWDPNLSAAFVGLTLRHGRPHLLRAVLEGAVYQVGLVVDVLRAFADAPRELRATGGGFTLSPLWPRIMAGALDADVVVTRHAEAAAWGAALVALSSLTGRPLRELAVTAVHEERRFSPEKDEVELYRSARAAFATLVDTIDFTELARLRSL